MRNPRNHRNAKNHRNPKSFAFNLPNLALPIRVLFTGYLLVIGVGLLMSGGQILLTHGMADGELGVSLDDVVYSYYGNRGNSKLEAKLNGSMKDKAPTHVRTEMIRWVQMGAPESNWQNEIQPLFQTHCVQCHGVIPGLPDFNSLDSVRHVSQIDKGASVDSLTRVSHIHLFGIAFIFFFVGIIFSLAVGFPQWLKLAALAMPFIFLLTDVVSWWLTKWNPEFAWLVIFSGVGYALASTLMWFSSMYQMWVLPYKGASYSSNEWIQSE